MSKKRRNNNSNNQSYKSKRRWKSVGLVALIILCSTVFVSAIGVASDGFKDANPIEWLNKDVNKDNLIKVENYVIKDGQDDGKGIEVKVSEDGVIKLKGKATSHNRFTVCTLQLEAGEYTISGVKSCDDYGIEVIGSNNLSAKSGISSATFKLETPQTVTVSIYANKGTNFFFAKTFEPCLVKGTTAGEFFE